MFSLPPPCSLCPCVTLVAFSPPLNNNQSTPPPPLPPAGGSTCAQAIIWGPCWGRAARGPPACGRGCRGWSGGTASPCRWRRGTTSPPGRTGRWGQGPGGRGGTPTGTVVGGGLKGRSPPPPEGTQHGPPEKTRCKSRNKKKCG